MLSDTKQTPVPFTIDIATNIESDDWYSLLESFDSITHRVIDKTLGGYCRKHGFEKLTDVTGAIVEVSLVFTNDDSIKRLNSDYREKDNPTNVLSFPDTELNANTLKESAVTDEPLILGDIVFALETIRQESQTQNKKFENHVLHLLVHGLLHLVGYDHIEQDEADIMEELEIGILREFDIDNPYISPDNKKGIS
ncbi:rRNA maturation RNase YbeY [Sneathiella marina]|uniref:Endoribonuclease YbeY n=1 Tax=Sneathiella marina TaxID=2950108 RepID=A0ABY4W682_9PROT|nr:rRNA maturation RNase YbeY [Sneathiella marina]USG61210.1 rRNA maturation RNase YbeY [Sneathiella marina]